MINGFSNHTP